MFEQELDKEVKVRAEVISPVQKYKCLNFFDDESLSMKFKEILANKQKTKKNLLFDSGGSDSPTMISFNFAT